jgi:hypothetical protein
MPAPGSGAPRACLPYEPIGPGAIWEQIDSWPASPGPEGETTLTVTLDEIPSDHVLRSHTVAKQTAPQQPYTIEGLPPDAVTTLESLLGEGSESAAIDLHRVTSASAGRIRSELAVNVQIGADGHAINQKSSVEASFVPDGWDYPALPSLPPLAE